MPLPLAIVVLGLALVGVAVSPRLLSAQPRAFAGAAAVVALLARGPEPAVTYVRLVACVVAVTLLFVRLAGTRREILYRMRVELGAAAALCAAVGAAVVLPGSSPAQPVLLAVIVALTSTFFAAAFVGVAASYYRAVRSPRAPSPPAA